MSKFLFALIVCAFFAGGQASKSTSAREALAQSQVGEASQTAAKPASSASESTQHAVDWAPHQYVDLWNGKQLDTQLYAAMFQNSTVMHSRGIVSPFSPGALARVIGAWRISMPDLHFTIEDTIIQGDKVVFRLAFTGTYTKILFARTFPPDHFTPPRKIHSDEVLIFRIKDGKIGEIWESYNEPLMRIQMGSTWCTMGEAAEEAKKPVPPAAATPSKP